MREVIARFDTPKNSLIRKPKFIQYIWSVHF